MTKYKINTDFFFYFKLHSFCIVIFIVSCVYINREIERMLKFLHGLNVNVPYSIVAIYYVVRSLLGLIRLDVKNCCVFQCY